MKLNLRLSSERLAVCRLEPDAAVPSALLALPFYSISRTAEELSLVVPETAVDAAWRCEMGWRVYQVAGPLDFSLVGILANLSQTLATANVSIFAISTFDTDYLLVKDEDVDTATAALTAVGHAVSQE